MSELDQYIVETRDYITCRRRPHCESCKKFEKKIRAFKNQEPAPLSIFDTDSANSVRLSFQNEGEAIFLIGSDGAVTVNPDIELDDVGRAFWKAVERTAPSAVYDGSHGGKMHMTEQQNKALLEKDPDYVAKLMTPANTPGKSELFSATAMNTAPSPLTCYTAEDMPALVALGYRRTSRKYGIISRVDRPDWKEFLARKGMLIGPGREGNGADHYRACYSKDKIELGTEFAYLALEVPTSGHDPVGFIPKDQLEQQAANAYAAGCSECGRMRTTVEVRDIKYPVLARQWQTLVINGVGVIEFELGGELAGKVSRALESEPEP